MWSKALNPQALSLGDFRTLFSFAGNPSQQGPGARWNLCLGAVGPWAGSLSFLLSSSLRAVLAGSCDQDSSFLSGPTLQDSSSCHIVRPEAGPFLAWLAQLSPGLQLTSREPNPEGLSAPSPPLPGFLHHPPPSTASQGFGMVSFPW